MDPTYASTYFRHGETYAQLGYGGYLRPEDAFPKAKAAASRALELDATIAEPHATLGYVAMYYTWDWAAADSEYRRALALNPAYPTAHESYGLFLAAMGRFDEAQAHERRAGTLDPLSLGIQSTTGWVLHYSGKQAEAERQLRIAVRTDSTFPIARLYLGRVLQSTGSSTARSRSSPRRAHCMPGCQRSPARGTCTRSRAAATKPRRSSTASLCSRERST